MLFIDKKDEGVNSQRFHGKLRVFSIFFIVKISWNIRQNIRLLHQILFICSSFTFKSLGCTESFETLFLRIKFISCYELHSISCVVVLVPQIPKIYFCKREWILGQVPMQFWDFSYNSLFPKILSLKLFGNLWGNSNARFLILGWFWWKMPRQGYEKKKSNFQICHTQFLNLKTQPIGTWKLQCPGCCETSFRYFAKCSLVPRINLSRTQNSYLCQKNQN